MSKRFLTCCYAAALAACLSLAVSGAARAQDQPAGEEDKVYRSNEVDRKAVFDRKSQRENEPHGYTCEPGSGVVRMHAVLRRDGKVSDIHLTKLSGCVEFDQSAVGALRKWRFKPAQKDGRAVSQYQWVEFRYHVGRRLSGRP